jgi:hypothetical protein
VITLSILGAGCIGRCSEDVETHYATFADARADMAFERGWLPPIVPRNAFDIWEFHNIDANRTWACFSVPDGPATTRALLLKRNAASASCSIGTLARPWWHSSMSTTALEAYKFTEEARFTVLVGIKSSAGRVCLHRF